jgi:hypothetical protein
MSSLKQQHELARKRNELAKGSMNSRKEQHELA